MVGFIAFVEYKTWCLQTKMGEDTNQIGRFEALDVILHRHFMDKLSSDSRRNGTEEWVQRLKIFLQYARC